jgi:hypothetical protein
MKSNSTILRQTGGLPLIICCLIVAPLTSQAAGFSGCYDPASWRQAPIDGTIKDEVDAGTTEGALYLKVHFDAAFKPSALKPGNIVEGVLAEPAYSGAREVLSAGTRIRLTVDAVERVRKPPNDHWPWMIKAFAPRHQNQPVFSKAGAILPDGREVSLKVSLISLADKKDVRAQLRTAKSAPTISTDSDGLSVTRASTSRLPTSTSPDTRTGRVAGTTASFEATLLTHDNASAGSSAASSELDSGLDAPPRAITIEAGTQARVILLEPISASKSRAGDVITARLVEPVRIGSKLLLPEGSLFEGKVVKAIQPRWLSRSGSLLLSFDKLTVPGGPAVPIAASLAGAELDSASQTHIDPEGNVIAGRPGRAWMLINLGTSMGLSKVADDGAQLVIQLIVSTATDASTAGVARIVAACASGVFMITRHGRDVMLPKYTEIRIVLDDPVTLTAPVEPSIVETVPSGPGPR